MTLPIAIRRACERAAARHVDTDPHPDTSICPDCGGQRGWYVAPWRLGQGTWSECPECEGKGRVPR